MRIALFIASVASSIWSAAPAANAQTNLAWCGVPYSGVRECVYKTLAQCEEDMRPLGGECEPNQ
jgi:hypothetical protein